MFQESPEENWEEAYRGLVSELQSKESRWTSVEADLRQAATQLSIAAMGQSAELDDVLGRIVGLVRDGTDPLAPEIENLIALLKRTENLDRSAVRRPAEARPAASVPEARSAPAATESILDIRMIVQALTRRLAGVPDLADVAEQIERQCDNEDWSAALTNVADSIAQVVSSLHAERRELEEFLASVTTQLADFERWAKWHLTDTKQRRSDNAEFEQTFAMQMRDLHEEVDATDDIVHLRSAVQTRLQGIAERFRQYREDEARRLSDAESRNAALTGEVNRLRRRTSELSEICGDQRDRLMFDALTRVHSRYAYEERLQAEYERWRDSGKPLAFTLWDIDRFKSINDTFGHDAGDRLLRRIGLILEKHRRSEDFVARIGGEEFVLLLPDTDVGLAVTVAERLRQQIAETPFNYHGKPQAVTISCGVTEFREGDSPLSVFKRADQALYDAKGAGRNCCKTG